MPRILGMTADNARLPLQIMTTTHYYQRLLQDAKLHLGFLSIYFCISFSPNDHSEEGSLVLHLSVGSQLLGTWCGLECVSRVRTKPLRSVISPGSEELNPSGRCRARGILSGLLSSWTSKRSRHAGSLNWRQRRGALANYRKI